MSKMSYLLGSSEQEQERLLDNLASYGQKRLLAVARPGMRVLDVGCGPGAVSALLAEAVGRSGSVVGVDLQREQLERAAVNARRKGLANVTFTPADATALPFGDGEFDLVYAKYLVMHLPDPLKGLGEMYRVLASNGVLFIYEVEEGGFLYWPEDTPTHRAWNLAMRVLREGGSDPCSGRKLYGYLRGLGLRDIRVIPEMAGACAEQARLLQAAKRQVAGVLQSMRDRIVGGSYASEGEVAGLIDALEPTVEGEFFTTTGINCWGRKP